MSEPSRIASHDVLRNRFTALWRRCTNFGSSSDPEPLWRELVRHYSESHRHYHVLAHLAHCIDWHERSSAGMDEPDAVEMALWFHDIIYQTPLQDNEMYSARLFRQRAGDSFPQEFTERVCNYIIATIHGTPPADPGAAYVQDIDLSSLGRPWAEFLCDSTSIRKEFSITPDAVYFTINHEFLGNLLRRERIYFTDFFYQHLEQAARENIRRYRHKLESEGLIRYQD